MTRVSSYFEDILRELDERPLPSAARLAIACGLCAHLSDLDDVETSILSGSQGGDDDFSAVERDVEELCRRVDLGPTDPRAARSALTWTMVPRNERLDAYILEFMVDTASRCGIEADKIIGTVEEVLRSYGCRHRPDL